MRTVGRTFNAKSNKTDNKNKVNVKADKDKQPKSNKTDNE